MDERAGLLDEAAQLLLRRRPAPVDEVLYPEQMRLKEGGIGVAVAADFLMLLRIGSEAAINLIQNLRDCARHVGDIAVREYLLKKEERLSLRLNELLHHLVILKPDKAWLLDHGAACHGTLL